MRMRKGLFVVMACFGLLLLPSVQSVSLAACPAPAKIVGHAYSPVSIQDAYSYASTTLGWTDFTLQLTGEIHSGDLLLNGGNVVLDGGYDCSFATKTSATGIFGTITVAGGAANFAGDVKIVSTSQCAFDVDGDGYTSIGSCSGSADDCNDNDFNINPGAAEICDGLDNNCNGQIDEGALPIDADGDGYYAIGSCGNSPLTDDCNDANGAINPGAVEIPYDGIDQDCNGSDMTFLEESDCADCHGGGSGYTTLHAFTGAAPDGTCVTCHSPYVSPLGNILPGHYGQTVRTAGNNMAAGATITCAACHDANAPNHSGGFAPFGGAMVVWQKVINAGANVTCDSCHETRAAAHMTATAHNNRVIDATCGTCHTSDTAVLGVPGSGTLASDADVDLLHQGNCGLCHAYTGTNMNAAVVRQAIGQGASGTQISCLDCHTDKATGHGSHAHTVAEGPGDLSYDAPGQLCSSCHVVSTWAEIEGVEHNVATNGASSCSTCHNSPRQDVIDAIAGGADPTNCLACHADKELTVHGNADHVALGYVTGGTSYCLDCHATGDVVNGTVITTHANNCSHCHTTVPALQPGVVAGGGDCTTCHTSTWASTHTTNPPSHNSLVQVATTGCGDCHSDPPPLTDAGDNKIHNACDSCHDASGGLISRAVGESFTVGGDCVTCHSEAWDTTHLMAPNHGMIVTVSGTSCGLCHDNTLISAAPKTHNACTSCHAASTGVLIGLAAGQAAPGNCVTCHTNTWESTHTSNTPNHGTLVQVATTSCASCHDDTLVSAATDTHFACTSCHNADGSLRSLAIGKDFATGGTCATCHTGAWDVTHTVAPDHTALVTVSGTSCGSCHDDTLVGVKSHFACTDCHAATTGALVSHAIGKNFTTGGTCATCHTNTWEVTHTTNPPSHNPLVQVAASSCGSCHSNPPPLTDAGDPKVHNACGSCHNATGGLVSLAVGKDFSTGGECATCHTATFDTLHAAHAHTVGLDANDLSNGVSCGDCHVVADWTEIEGTEHNVATNGTGSCSTCHSSSRQEVVDAIALGAAPTACLDCHSSQAASHADCNSCHISNGVDHTSSNENATVHAGHIASNYVSGCIDCHSNAGPGHADHNNGTVNFNNTAISSTDDYDRTAGNFDGTCATNSCHDSDAGEWAAGNLGGDSCVDCHAAAGKLLDQGGYPPTSNEHAAHLGNDAIFLPASDCNLCHGPGAVSGGHANHKNNGASIDLGGSVTTYAGGDCTNSCHVAAAGGADDWTGNVSLGCNDCHGSGKSLDGGGESDLSTSVGPNAGRHDDHTTSAHASLASNCTDCHGHSGTLGSSGSTGHVNGMMTNDGLNLTTISSPDCTNVCHDVNPGTDGDWLDTLPLACQDCHSGSYVGGVPASGLHGASNVTDHTGAGFTCSSCHDASPSAGHINNTTQDSTQTAYAFNGSNVLSYSQAVGCAATAACHQDGGNWSRKWVGAVDLAVTIAMNPGDAVCDNCHGDFDSGFRTGVTGRHTGIDEDGDIVNNHQGDQPGNDCYLCHGWQHAAYTAITGPEAHRDSKIQVNSASKVGFVDNGETVGCSNCHAANDGTDDEQHAFVDTLNKLLDPTDNDDDTAVDKWGRQQIEGPEVSCDTCHGNLPSGLHGNPSENATLHAAHNASGYIDSGVVYVPGSAETYDNCNTCHGHNGTGGSHNNGTVNFAGQIIAVAYDYDKNASFGGSCGATNGCHDSDPGEWSSGDLGSGGDNACVDCHGSSAGYFGLLGGEWPIASGEHAAHLASNTYVPNDCADCHGAGAATAGHAGHLNEMLNVASDVSSYNPGDGTCANSCHTVVNGRDWTAGNALACDDCHAASSKSLYRDRSGGSHPAHVDTSVDPTVYGGLGNTSTQTQYNFNCGECHPTNTANHLNGGVAEIKPSITYNGSDQCSNVYCHSYIDAGNTRQYQTTPAWGSSFGGDSCVSCHANSPVSNAHHEHEVGFHYAAVYSGLTGFLPVNDTDSYDPGLDDTILDQLRGHGGNIGGGAGTSTSTTITCYVCHYDTVKGSYNANNATCAACHTAVPNPTAGDMAAGNAALEIFDKSKHVDGVADVIFVDQKIRSKAQLRDDLNDVPEISNNWTRVNGYKAVDGVSYDEQPDTLNNLVSWNPGDKTCTSSCHLWEPGRVDKVPVDWEGGSIICIDCHTRLPR